LASDLASDTHRCTLAYWHHPRFSSGTDHGGTTAVQPFWSLLAADRAELVLTGHEHNYERFAKQNGITEFVIGTGGVAEPGYPFGSPEPNSVKRIRGIKAVGKFTLNTGGWSMQLVTALGDVKDSASGSCS
jgi:alkaline phosphatase